MTVRAMTPADVPRVVVVHELAFPHFFLSSLGPAFLRAFYRSFIGRRDTVALVATGDDGTVVGFVVGAVPAVGFYRRLLAARWAPMTIAALGALLKRPTAVLRLLGRLAESGAPLGAPAPAASLLSIATDPTHQGRGAGQALVGAFIEAGAHLGAASIVLTTDAEGNDAVNAFYRRTGFTLARRFTTREGRVMNEYLRRC